VIKKNGGSLIPQQMNFHLLSKPRWDGVQGCHWHLAVIKTRRVTPQDIQSVMHVRALVVGKRFIPNAKKLSAKHQHAKKRNE